MHGARFAADAVAGGAVAVLTDPAGAAMLPSGVAVLVHPAPRSVLGAAAALVYGDPSSRLKVIGVTGTSGKTTTTYLVEAGLRAAGRSAGLIGTVGIRVDGVDQPSALTTPEAPALQALLAAMAEQHVDTVVMEVSSHALALGPGRRRAIRGGGLHKPVPRPPRLPPVDGGLLRHQGTAFRCRFAAARRRRGGLR